MSIDKQNIEPEQINELEEINRPADNTQANVENQGEFKISVRKLELPVRPRGVLAE